MHTFDDWELRQLLEDTLETAWRDYRGIRASADKTRGAQGKSQDWHFAAGEAVKKAMDGLWFDRTRPAATRGASPCP
jgi:hypothetical protein